MKFWKNFGFRIPFWDFSRTSLRHFEQLLFLKRLNPSSLSKLMIVRSFFVLNFWNIKSMINLYNVRILPPNIHSIKLLIKYLFQK